MLDFRLNTFLTLCDTMNYRRAAEILNVTQPSVTQHIQYLERYYDCDLFIYDGRKLKMTPQAVILKKYSESMQYQEKKLMQSLETPKGYFLKIGATRTIGEYVIEKQVSKFLEQPDNNVSIQIDNTNKILELIHKGKIDFGIVEGYFNKAEYASKIYSVEPFVGFCSKNHAFAGKTIPLEEIFKQDIVVREKGSGTREMLDQLLVKHNYSVDNFNRITVINNMSLISNLVSDNLGITFAYLSAGKDNDKIVPFYIKDCDMSREFDYVYLKDTQAEEFVKIFDEYKEKNL